MSSFAEIKSIDCPEVFQSSEDNYLYANIQIENSSELIHSCQIVFRGYVRKGDVLLYEFFHEQQWLVVNSNSNETHNVSVDIWLPRFPPSMTLDNGIVIEYCVRATINPWFENQHVDRIFYVKRSLILKMPHISCYPIENRVNKCVEHGKLMHKKCDPINGHLKIEKGAYTFNEEISVSWNLKTEKSIFEHFKLKLVQIIEIRLSEPDVFMRTQKVVKVLTEKTSTSDQISIYVPDNCFISIPMSLWNVLSIRHELVLEAKLQKQKRMVQFEYPIIICSEEVAKRNMKNHPGDLSNMFSRVQDVDDDSDDDDDYDSEDDIENQQPDRQYSLDIEKLTLTNSNLTDEKKQLERAEVEVTFIINSNEPRPLNSLRLLLTGEVRVNTTWYEFVRFKAIAKSTADSLFSPGQHKHRFQLPFAETQYDVSILPPSLGDEVRYIVRASTESLRQNLFDQECEILIDRFVDTWAKEAFKPSYEEEYGSTKISMQQRCFKRGKRVIILIEGEDIREIKGTLIQEQRLRIPGYRKDDSFCLERTVIITEDEVMKSQHTHISQIPPNIPPSIEICYWNVLQIQYSYKLEIILEGGHSHTHSLPIWIGCTEDNLEVPPEVIAEREKQQMEYDEPLDELPEFEVVNTEETQMDPYWVERFNTDTYGYKEPLNDI
ncbi:unnamed protein product [Caenorhabditis angaria]|uniref:Arrestin C-terminal-like domain-containing protein n=1 Tax=Caenorhabditis angaria TaxID=860376 RepID=A0A9P1J2X7_9PELO|nr:unnamed protein product [Caenorhabditis angaria]